jgi:hypothetical protein
MDMGIDEFMDKYYKGEIPSIGYMYGKDMKSSKLEELQDTFLGDDE